MINSKHIADNCNSEQPVNPFIGASVGLSFNLFFHLLVCLSVLMSASNFSFGSLKFKCSNAVMQK